MKRVFKNEKGFTLIEIIVVLVILAILAAAMIPSMLGFIEDSRGKAMVAEARTASMAVQSIYTDITLSTGTPPHTGAAYWIPTSTHGGRLFDMLQPDVTLVNGPVSNLTPVGTVIVSASFNANGTLNYLKYNKRVGNRFYTVTVTPGSSATVESNTSLTLTP